MARLKILFVEDISVDVELAVRELKTHPKIDFNYTTVDNEYDFRKAIDTFEPDIIISDYVMPSFDGMSALKITRELPSYIPFIILTGSMNEETAVACMKSGADDYVIKEKIKRLPFAVKEVIIRNSAIQEKKKMQKQLIDSEKKFSDIFYKHSVVKLIIDPVTSAIVEANNAAAEFYGWSVDELKTMTFTQISTRSSAEIATEIKSTLEKGKYFSETIHQLTNGDIRNVEIFSSKIGIRKKDYLHLIVHDVTDKKKAEEQLALLNRAVEQSSASIMITNSEGNIVYVNPAFEKITGYVFEEVKNKNPRLLKSNYHPDEYFKEMWQKITSGSNWEGELQNRKKNGETYWLKSTISPIHDKNGKITHFIAVRDDITDKKQMIEKLIIAKEKAEESDRLKSAFLANMSHEIRTPMNGILGFTSLLLEPDLTSKEKSKYIGIIHKSGQRMLNTVNDIIEISKIEAGIVTIIRTETNVNKTFEDIIQFFQIEAKNKGLKLSIEQLLPKSKGTVLTDAGKLESIISNLIKNAIKYTDKGSIKAGCCLKNKNIEFYVEDTGIGIAENKLEAIFNHFEQADIEDKRAFEGSGLGLAISKSYVEMLGGKIWVKSEYGKGSIFFFTIPNESIKANPRRYPTARKLEMGSEVGNYREKLKILIAEDDETSYMYLSNVLNAFNCEILHSTTGNETIKLLRNSPDIDIILMDIEMPKMDGFEATRKIREFNKKVHIIAQTAYVISGDQEKALNIGCNDYIAKPVNKDELIDKIRIIQNIQ